MSGVPGQIVVPARFNGPPGSGNGGYVAGLAAACVDGVAEVTLNAPPPLDTPMQVDGSAEGVTVRVGDRVVATARGAALDLEAPAMPSHEDVAAMSRHYVGFEQHAFSTCFVCGPARSPGDGLRIFAGRRAGDAIVAAPWTVDPAVADRSGRVPAAMVWAALDCPGYFAFAAPGDAAVLGRMTGAVTQVPELGERCVVVGWALGADGRKHFAGTALYAEDGRLLARTRQVWIDVPAGSFAPG